MQIELARPKRPNLEAIKGQVAALVNRQVGASVSSDAPLMEAGLDSLGAVELRTALASGFGIELPATVIFDHPSIAALAGFIASVGSGSGESQVSSSWPMYIAPVWNCKILHIVRHDPSSS